MPKCFKCGQVVSSINGMQRHFKFVHKLDEFTAVYKCAEPDCYVTCSSWGHLRRHFKVFHHFCANPNAKVPCLVEQPLENNKLAMSESTQIMISADNDVVLNSKEPDSGNFGEHIDVYASQSVVDFNEPDSRTLGEHVEIYASQLVAKLCSKPGRPRSLVQEFVNDTSEFLSSTLSLMDQIVKSKLKSVNVEPDVITEICETLSILKSPFKGLSTEHLRLNYLRKEGYYIEPKDYIIDSDLFAKSIKGKIILEPGPVKGQYIKLGKVLKAFLELPNVLSIITNFLQSPASHGIISDFIHGPHWQDKKKHFEGKLVIPLIVYDDDYEVDKELGPHSAKLGVVLVKIASLPPEFQGSLDNIFLALLFKACDREEFGNEAVFRKFIKEMNYLQSNGIEVTTNGQTQKVYFTIGLVTADNLAIHNLLGFAGGFSANYCCRICRVHKSVMHFQCKEDPKLLRDKIQHKLDCAEGNVTNTGVKGPSVFDGIEYFETTENPSFDIMHDIFEGACDYDMGHVLHYCIFEKKYFTTDILNFRIIAFNYGSSVSNKPNQLKEKWVRGKSIKMTASEMRTFVRTFALLVGDLVDEAEPVWDFYLILRDIIDILLCRHVQEEVLILLQRKISEHHRLYVELFSDTLKPKHHLMLHYHSIMRKSGVPINYSCDRFEGKHQPSVQDARGTTSRKNIAHTLAMKEQLRMANRLMCQRGLVSVLEVGPEKTCFLDPFLPLPHGFVEGSIAQYAYVNYKGTMYKEDSCVVIGSDADGGPEFGLVKSLLINLEGDVCLVCSMLSAVNFSTHYHAYVVTKTMQTKAILLSHLMDYLPILFCKGFDGKDYVTLHHAL